MPTGLCANRRCASVPSLGLLVGLSSLQPIEVGGLVKIGVFVLA
jgi:hypothetical protein